MARETRTHYGPNVPHIYPAVIDPNCASCQQAEDEWTVTLIPDDPIRRAQRLEEIEAVLDDLT